MSRYAGRRALVTPARYLSVIGQDGRNPVTGWVLSRRPPAVWCAIDEVAFVRYAGDFATAFDKVFPGAEHATDEELRTLCDF